MFEGCRPSQMNTQECHVSDHICDGIREVEGLTYLNAVLFESGHKHFKKEYNPSSRKMEPK